MKFFKTNALIRDNKSYGVLSKKLTEEYGKGWSEKQLRHCQRFAKTFKEKEIVYSVRRQLTWTHSRTHICIDNEMNMGLYTEICRLEGYTTKVLNEKIDSMLFERRDFQEKAHQSFAKKLSGKFTKYNRSVALVMAV
jgi:hypothetical protein